MNNPIADPNHNGRTQEIARIILNTQERERFEVGKELHDNVCQMLATVKLYMETGLKDDNHLREFVCLGKDLLMKSMEELRRISRSLAPPTLGHLPLRQSLEELVHSIQIARKEIYLTIEGLNEDLVHPELRISIYRIVQEQLNNVLKHAAASVVHVSIHEDGAVISLRITDDGRGFDPRKKREGIGINNIINRAELFNGQVNIESAAGKGCILSVKFQPEGD